jgi:hypothetical protein
MPISDVEEIALSPRNPDGTVDLLVASYDMGWQNDPLVIPMTHLLDMLS